ncbi:MAG: SOS response-associated peptidase [Bacteroidota bacterium]
MCYSNSLSSNVIQLESTYRKGTEHLKEFSPIYVQSGFTFPVWPVITAATNFIPMHWGLVPSWFRGTEPMEMARKTLNARVETLNDKASFKHLVQQQRCIIPSTGFFENQTIETHKKPFFIFPKNDVFFHMAGLYDQWTDVATRHTYHSFTVITTEANAMMAEIHNTKKRMPLMLPEEQLDPFLQGKESIGSYLPLSEGQMSCHPINKRIFTSSENNVPSVQHRVEDNIGRQGLLF